MKYKNNEIHTFLKLGTSLSIISILLILWVLIAKVDVIANTTGKIITESKNQTISILDKSAIEKVLVKEGDFVKKGQIVATLNNTIQNSSQNQIITEINYYKLRLKAIDSLINNSNFVKNKNDEDLQFSQIYSEFSSRKLTFESNYLSTQAEISQFQNELQTNTFSLEKLKASQKSWQRQIDSYEKIKDTGYISSLTAEEKIREGKEKIDEIKVQESYLSVNQSKIKQSQLKLKTLKSDFTQQLLKEKTEIIQKVKSLEEEKRKTDYNVNIKNLVSPVDGYVKEITNNSHNSVITEGNVLMTIVPTNEVLKAELLVKNSDIGYILEGQQVQIKVETFAFQKHGLITGTVIKISPDSTEDKDTKQNFYHIQVKLNKDYVQREDKKYFIKPGMVVNADIILSQRTIFEYLTSPLQKTILESARER